MLELHSYTRIQHIKLLAALKLGALQLEVQSQWCLLIGTVTEEQGCKNGVSAVRGMAQKHSSLSSPSVQLEGIPGSNGTICAVDGA